MKQQRGGTFLGMVIGVVIGLAAALAVAVYVTKVPVPFMNKAQSRTAEQDAAEARKNKDWDPNAPLYGKNPARPASAAASGVLADAPQAPSSAGAAPAAMASTSRAPASAVASAPARAEARQASASDPLGDLARARAAAPSAAAKPASGVVGTDPFTYFVQVGAYRTVEDAEAQRAKLGLLGMEAKVSEREQSGRTVFRVRVGPYEKKEDADRAKEKLDAASIETALVRVQR